MICLLVDPRLILEVELPSVNLSKNCQNEGRCTCAPTLIFDPSLRF